MTSRRNLQHEVHRLIEELLEQTLQPEGVARLEQLLRSSRTARRQYQERVMLHGLLHWDGAHCTEPLAGDEDDQRSIDPAQCSLPDLAEISAGLNGAAPFPLPNADDVAPATTDNQPVPATGEAAGRQQRLRRRSLLLSLGTVVALVLFGIGVGLLMGNRLQVEDMPRAAAAPDAPPAPGDVSRPPVAEPVELPSNGTSPAVLARTNPTVPAVSPQPRRPVVAPGGLPAEDPFEIEVPAGGSSDTEIVTTINRRLRAGWSDSGVEPSEEASREEWIRRVWLDLAGSIPTVAQLERFSTADTADWRSQLVDELLDSPAFVQHHSTTWANLLVGRSEERGIEREAVERYLRQQLAANRGWDEIVTEIVTAEGTLNENPAAGYLLAHLNNEAVPATAITARLFLGTQVQCTQCHDHPFNDWTQNQFWELNGFFQQTAAVSARKLDPSAADDALALVSEDRGGPIYFETRRGLMRAAFPRFEGTGISPDGGVNRRQELARIITAGPRPQLAAAFVNRLWSHFFGYGFTRPVDDMGPHNPPTHPQLLDRLAREFVASGYDVRRLIRWITASDAYHLTSRIGSGNTQDDPEAGYLPVFSRVYVRPLTAEQLYDSLLVATRGERVLPTAQAGSGDIREEWLRQFVVNYETDENDEASTFEGTITQALMMMNGELVDAALASRAGTWLHEVAEAPTSDNAKVRRIWLAALSREPTAEEHAAARQLLRRVAPRSLRGPARQQAITRGLQDLFWACLNSSEFLLVH